MFTLIISLFLHLLPIPALAADENYLLPVIPLRERQYWREGGDPKHLTNMINLATQSGLPVTWLIHYDILKDKPTLQKLKNLPKNHEIGIFLEITKELAKDAKVYFDWQNDAWSSPHKLFLQGYQPEDRVELINTFFDRFHQEFGYSPKSYGAWYVDGLSSSYIREKYNSTIQLGLADQYSTDGYQVWGQHINTPYLLNDKNVIEPSPQDKSNNILKVLWAPREPTLSYGNSVLSSNFSLQANDYYRSKNLPHSYFQKTLDTLTDKVTSPITGVVIGLEVGEVSDNFLPEFENQLTYLKKLSQQNYHVTTLKDFEINYRKKFTTTPPSFIKSEHEEQSSYWYQSTNYRVGFFIENGKLYLKDLRFYNLSDLYDNDQHTKDTSRNLSRVAPAIIDHVSLHNQITLLENATKPEISTQESQITLVFPALSITLTPEKIYLNNKALSEKLTFAISDKDQLIIERPPANTKPRPNCANEYGYYQGKLPCLKTKLIPLLSFIPDLVYTKLGNTYFLGLKTGKEQIKALTFPDVTFKSYSFDAQILESFISLRKKITPNLPWYGLQEDQLPTNSTPTLKDYSKYGQEEILKLINQPKRFENGFYFIPQ